MRPTRGQVRRSLLLGAAALACGRPGFIAAAPAPSSAQQPGHLPSVLRGLSLVDHRGRPFAGDHLRGHPTLLQFVYTQCSSVCPVQTRALVEMHARLPVPLRSRLQLLSISLDPLSDTPATLARYARRMDADQPGWRWVTGRPEHIWRLADTLQLFPPPPRPGQPAADARRSAFRQTTQSARDARLEDHATSLWLLDDQGDVRQRYTGQPVDVPRLAREIAALDELLRTAVATR